MTEGYGDISTQQLLYSYNYSSIHFTFPLLKRYKSYSTVTVFMYPVSLLTWKSDKFVLNLTDVKCV